MKQLYLLLLIWHFQLVESALECESFHGYKDVCNYYDIKNCDETEVTKCPIIKTSYDEFSCPIYDCKLVLKKEETSASLPTSQDSLQNAANLSTTLNSTTFSSVLNTNSNVNLTSVVQSEKKDEPNVFVIPPKVKGNKKKKTSQKKMSDPDSVDCGDKLCELSVQYLDSCVVYLPTDNINCSIPCKLNGCDTEIRSGYCEIWFCKSKPIPPTPIPPTPTPPPGPTPPIPFDSYESKFFLSLGFNLLEAFVILIFAIGLAYKINYIRHIRYRLLAYHGITFRELLRNFENDAELQPILRRNRASESVFRRRPSRRDYTQISETSFQNEAYQGPTPPPPPADPLHSSESMSSFQREQLGSHRQPQMDKFESVHLTPITSSNEDKVDQTSSLVRQGKHRRSKQPSHPIPVNPPRTPSLVTSPVNPPQTSSLISTALSSESEIAGPNFEAQHGEIFTKQNTETLLKKKLDEEIQRRRNRLDRLEEEEKLQYAEAKKQQALQKQAQVKKTEQSQPSSKQEDKKQVELERQKADLDHQKLQFEREKAQFLRQRLEEHRLVELEKRELRAQQEAAAQQIAKLQFEKVRQEEELQQAKINARRAEEERVAELEKVKRRQEDFQQEELKLKTQAELEKQHSDVQRRQTEKLRAELLGHSPTSFEVNFVDNSSVQKQSEGIIQKSSFENELELKLKRRREQLELSESQQDSSPLQRQYSLRPSVTAKPNLPRRVSSLRKKSDDIAIPIPKPLERRIFTLASSSSSSSASPSNIDKVILEESSQKREVN